MKLTAIISAAILPLLALAGCDKSEPPDVTPAAAPEQPYQAPQDQAPATSPETMPGQETTPGQSTDAMPPPGDEGTPAFGEPPSDSPSEPPKNPSG